MTRIPFAYEDDLCAVLAQHLHRVILPTTNPRHVRALAQRPVGTVVPDFICVRSDRITGDKTARISGLTTLEACIVATLMGGRSLRDVTIAKLLFSRVERIAPHLHSLERLGLLSQATDGVFALRRGAFPRSVHVVAVEAKLHRWREAVEQAASYLAFANQSYVALPRRVVTGNAALGAAVAARRVGLLAVEPDGVTIVKRAPRHRIQSPGWIWLLSRTVALAPSSARVS